MKTVTVKNITFGQGMPKICVPIVATTKEGILEEAKALKGIHVDVVEWRVDWYEEVSDISKVQALLDELEAALAGIPLLFTFRTSNEGGNKAIEPKDYEALIIAAAKSHKVDLVDVEIFIGDSTVSSIIEKAHQEGVKVIASNHDFDKTPAKEDIIYRLRKMQDMGADIPKIAVMPTCTMDVLTLLEATTIMKEQYACGPIITMSMAGTGVISRLAGEVFGSCLTFGAAKKASAPGQIDVEALYGALELIHKSSH